MIPSFKPGIMSSNQIRAAGGGADVTPNAVNWDDYTFIAYNGTVQGTASGAKTISGINTSINIYFSCIYCGDFGTVYYKKNGGSWTSVSENQNISVSNGDTIDWGVADLGYISFAVKNASDSNATLDSVVEFDSQFA